MGYLKGVPFFWVAHALWPMWAMVVGLLLVIFFVIDEWDHRKVVRDLPRDSGPAVSILGFQNVMFLGMILVAVFRPSVFDAQAWRPVLLSREILMLAAAGLSRWTTKPHIYGRNQFTYGPIAEVTILFLGIFATMVPALNYLSNNAEKMPLKTAGQYYFFTGALSSVLDNAPTYLVFLETRQGQIQHQYDREITQLRAMLAGHPPGRFPSVPETLDPRVLSAYQTLVKYNTPKILRGDITDADIRIAMIIGNRDFSMYLVAMSIGAVFFGACTYIGNGPNFMVKSIAESAGVKMPSFFGYVLRFALPVLIPLYVLVWVVFFFGKPA